MGWIPLQDFLKDWTHGSVTRKTTAEVVTALTNTALAMSELVARGRMAHDFSKPVAPNDNGSEQKEIDVLANTLIIDALKTVPVAALASEELAVPMLLDPKAPILVAVDPLDGSSNVDANVSFGMIFSLLPRHAAADGEAAFLRAGSQQLAAGIIVYGPKTTLTLTLGSGTHNFTLDRETRTFMLTRRDIAIPAETSEYAINASNARYWEEPIRIYIHDCENGANGPHGHDYNFRWTGSPVADIYRILSRGGIYLYPGDSRKGFHQGRIRLIYEANPIGFLVEQAGGRATTGAKRLLDVVPVCLHQKTPLICGSRDEVARVERLYSGEVFKGERSPLFGRRGLFRAFSSS